jgi:hypothetical protein
VSCRGQRGCLCDLSMCPRVTRREHGCWFAKRRNLTRPPRKDQACRPQEVAAPREARWKTMEVRVTSKPRPVAEQGIHVLSPRGTTNSEDGIQEIYAQRRIEEECALCRTQGGKGGGGVSSISGLFWIPSQSPAQEWSA